MTTAQGVLQVAIASQDEHQKHSSHHEITILVIHHEQDCREFFHQALVSESYQVIEHARADEARAHIEQLGLPDAVLLAAHLPDDDAFELCRWIRALPAGAQTSVIFIHDRQADIQPALEAGADEFVLQPVTPELLRWRIHQGLRLRQALRQHQEEQERLELVLKVSEISTWDWDMVSNQMTFSPSWYTMLGYQPEEMSGDLQDWQDLIHPRDRDEVRAALENHIQFGEPYQVTCRIRSRHGWWKWVLSAGQVTRYDADGRPVWMTGTYSDIDSTKRIQEALRKSEERHRIISDTISDYAYAYIVNEDGSLKKDWATQAFYDITGYTFQELEDIGWERLIHPEDMGIAGQRHVRLLSGEVDVSEFRVITKSGEVCWLRDHAYPVIDEDSRRVVRIYGAAQNITQRKQYEQQLQQQARELQDRNEELDAFAYSVAHDLKNPISSMMGFASLVQSYYDRMPDDQVREYLSLIMESGYKLKDIINALLMLAGVNKMGSVEMGELDMGQIIEDARRRLQTLIDESEAQIIAPGEWPRASGYGPWVEEVWANYISNALKYGGRPPIIELGADTLDNGMVRFWVRDNGTGLTPDEQQKIFTPFTRLNQIKIEGHGLGLSVVQRIVQKLGGEVGVESAVGQGSVFSFTLPRAE
jgi:PAS domain S-box-containing protein